jgi:hypothetical protein
VRHGSTSAAVAAAALWTAGTAALLLLRVPAPVEELAGGLVDLLALDKIAHLVLFFWLAWSWLRVFQPARWGVTVAVVALVIAYGGVLELVQTVLGEREGEWLDFVADGVGGVLAPFLRARSSPHR